MQLQVSVCGPCILLAFVDRIFFKSILLNTHFPPPHTKGELKGKGTYQLHYRNVFHAAWTIARTDGVLALQKGLGPALVYQFVMNGVRLG